MDGTNKEFDKNFYQEQGPEQIMAILEEAIKKGSWLKIRTASDGSEENPSNIKGTPQSFDGSVVWIATENKGLVSVEISKIKMVQLPEAENKEETVEK